MPAPLEKTDPEKFADFLLEYAQDTDGNIAALARACGLNERSAKYIVKRLEGQYQPVVEEARRLSTGKLIEKIEGKLPMLLDGITKAKVDDAPIREIAVAFGVLAEKRQLLKGEPTQILSYEERRNLNDLLPALKMEAERRGMVVDVDYTEVASVKVDPPDTIQEEAVSATARRQASREKRAKNR